MIRLPDSISTPQKLFRKRKAVSPICLEEEKLSQEGGKAQIALVGEIKKLKISYTWKLVNNIHYMNDIFIGKMHQ